MKILLKNAGIISYDGEVKVIKNGYLGIEDDLIIYIGENKPEEKYDTEKDMSGKFLIPGLINSHNHSPMTLLRGVGSDLPLDRWLNEAVFPIEDKLTKEDIRIGSKVALLEMIASGITSFSDMYIFPEETIDEVCKAKTKANISRCILSFDPNESAKDNFRVAESINLYKNYHNYDNGRIKIDFSIHAEYTSTENVVREYSQMCNEIGGRMHLHLSETEKEHNACIEKYGKTPAEWFNDMGTFDSPTQAAHCVMVTDSDMDILKEKNVTVVHNPTSNMKLGSGFAPICKFLEKGINVALGTDGTASNNNLNMLEEMHIASIIHKGKLNDPTVVSPSDIFKFSTINGAKTQGRDDTGALCVGKKADIVAISLCKPHMIPHFDLLSTLVYTAQASDVCMTMVDGKIIYENGIYYTIDAEKALSEFKNTLERIHN